MTTLCTKDDMVNYLSLRGVISFSDHDDTGVENDEVINDCRQFSSDELIGWLSPMYAVSELALSTLVTRWATIIACYRLCKTRGNPVPESLHEEYENLISIPNGMVHQARNQKFIIPNIRRQTINVPAFSNLTIDRRYRREKIRVIQANSSNIPSAIEQDATNEIVRG